MKTSLALAFAVLSAFQALQGAGPTPLFTDNNFQSFPGDEWALSGTSPESTISVCETDSAEGEVVKSLFLNDENPQVPGIAAKVMIGDLSQAAINKGITVAFDMKMENPGDSNRLFFRVLGSQTKDLNRYVGGVQFMNWWGGTQGGLKYGNAHTSIGDVAYNRWFRVEVRLPGEEGEQKQTVTIQDIMDPERVYTFSEKTNTDVREYAALLFSSDGHVKLAAYIRNISVVTNP